MYFHNNEYHLITIIHKKMEVPTLIECHKLTIL